MLGEGVSISKPKFTKWKNVLERANVVTEMPGRNNSIDICFRQILGLLFDDVWQ